MSLMFKTKSLLNKYNINPVHYRGQNFLISEKVLDKIISFAGLSKEDTVLEVGPGLGFLTTRLAKKAGRVLAVELDLNLADILLEELKSFPNVKIVNNNILKTDISKYGLENGKYKIVANLPYNITSRFIRTFLEIADKPTEMLLMIQREVAERIVAKPGQMSLLSLSCQFYADCSIEFAVGRNHFYPAPKVESAVIRLKLKDNKDIKEADNIFKLAHLGFSSKRKKLAGNLAKGLEIDKEKINQIFKKLNLDEGIRAQSLSVNDWISLSKEL